TALSADLRQQRLTDDAFEHERELRANLRLLVRWEYVDHAVDSGRSRIGVQGTKGQVARFRYAQSGFNGLQIAHLADEDNVRVFAQDGAEGLGEAFGIRVNFALVAQTILVRVHELDRIFDGDDVV